MAKGKAVKKATAKKTNKKADSKTKGPKKATKVSKTTSSAPSMEGKKAPDFSFVNTEGNKKNLSDYQNNKSWVVLYFYPKDDTPGCTKQACQFRDDAHMYGKIDAVILGVSPDNQASHQKFREKFDLNFSLVSDENHKISQAYGVWVEKNMYGRKYMGVQRATFLISPDGKIAKHWPKVSVDGHSNDVVATLKELRTKFGSI